MFWLPIVISLCIGTASAVHNYPSLAPLTPFEHTEHTIPEEYIVVFKQDACKARVQEHMNSLNNMLEAFDGVYYVKHTYDMGRSFRGYSARMDEMTLERVRHMSEVDYVERNQMGHFDKCIVQTPANWGLARISHKGPVVPPNIPSYDYDAKKQGDGVNIYIIDTGIDVMHPDFDGRAKWGQNFVNPGVHTDPVGHGTGVAGVAMSTTYGVAKKATAIALGIVGLQGNPPRYAPIADAAIKAFDWLAKNHKPGKSVANGSFRVSSAAINDAADALFKAGVPLVVTAGNAQQGELPLDACTQYPASAKEVITVAASDASDTFASFSFFGQCVNIIAPGVDIQTTGLCGTIAFKSGTSFAAPLVTGVLARLLTDGKLTASQARSKVYELTEMRVINNVPPNTPNLILNDVCE